MHDAVALQLAHRVACQGICAQVHQSDASGQSGYNARTERSTGYEPNVGVDESETTFVSIADGDDDLIGIENYQLGQVPLVLGLEDHVLQITRKSTGAVFRAAQKQAAFGEVPDFPHIIPHNTQHLMHA